MSSFSNTMKKDVSTRTIFPEAKALIDDTISFVQGDLLFLDTTAHLIKPVAAQADAATLLGVAPVTIVDGKYQKAYLTDVDDSLAVPAIPGPQYGSTYQFTLIAGDAINPGDKVYVDTTGPQFVTVTGGMGILPVGVYQGAALTAPTGGAKIEVLVVQNYQAGV